MTYHKYSRARYGYYTRFVINVVQVIVRPFKLNFTPVSYTHLDVYKRQDLGRQIRYRSLRLIVLYKSRWSKIRIDPRTMSLRSKTPKTGRLSCKKCAMFERKTATDRLRTSNKVPFAPSHRPLQDSMVQN